MHRPSRSYFLLLYWLIALPLSFAQAAPGSGELPDTLVENSVSESAPAEGPFAEAILQEENDSHVHFSAERHRLQEKILEKYEKEGQVSSAPRAVFLAGTPGVGKSTVVQKLERQRWLDRGRFLWIDPDMIRQDLPEYSDFVRRNPELAAEKTHGESSFLSRVLIRIGVKEKKNLLVDTSFTSLRYWNVFTGSEADPLVPNYQKTLIAVTADPGVVAGRIAKRRELTGRGISASELERYRKSFDEMQPFFRGSDRFHEIFRIDTSHNDALLTEYFGDKLGHGASESHPNIPLESFFHDLRARRAASADCGTWFSTL